MLKTGSVLDGKYEIIKKIGAGGTSTVYLAMNQKLSQQWVIKEISKNISSNQLKKVLKEASMMKEFDNPSIPRIVDILERNGNRYIVMDYISGQSLWDIVKEQGPQPQEKVLEWGRQLVNVLVYLHSLPAPVIYHDLKPQNLILKMPENNLKLIDFGEARKKQGGKTPPAGYTPRYAAPEQQKNTRGDTDERTDIYCFGTTLYRLLTGELPPKLPEPVGSVMGRFPDLQITSGMDAVIAKCTDTDPEKRFQSAAELKEALDHLELWDAAYIKSRRGRIRLCAGMFAAGIIFLTGSFGLNAVQTYRNSQTYESLIATTADVPAKIREQNYVAAIKINGDDTRAYLKLLELYQDIGFGDMQSQTFSNLYNDNKAFFSMADEDVLALNYEIGTTYFNIYSGEEASLRSRMQKAASYFSNVVEYGTESYENYGMASSYNIFCEFFIDYVLNDTGTLEPTKEAYEQVLEATLQCMKDMQSYAQGDAAATRLQIYEALLDMITSNARGFARSGIEQETVLSVIKSIIEAADNEFVSQENNIQMQQRVVSMENTVTEIISNEYQSVERGT